MLTVLSACRCGKVAQEDDAHDRALRVNGTDTPGMLGLAVGFLYRPIRTAACDSHVPIQFL